MRNFKYIWLVGLIATALIVTVPIILFVSAEATPTDNPRQFLPERSIHVDHTALIKSPLETGPEVTKLCITCHENAAFEVMQTNHWTWLSEPVEVAWSDERVATGKKNLFNNFCLGITSNWITCTTCHAGYGWTDANFDFSNPQNVDCLVCHDQSGAYSKSKGGFPADGTDLVTAAQSVGSPTRENCGGCHFNGGGGNGVKHGDLDQSLYYPPDEVDVHMGRENFQCVDCHQTDNHLIQGRAISVSVDNVNQIYCTNCHSKDLHEDDRINAHVESVACQTCHIPAAAVREPTKMEWDWSTAGQDREDDPHEYLKIKGSFVYEDNITPTYAWFNGTLENRYLLGDPLDSDGVTTLNPPDGDIKDPTAKIWPFKVHKSNQPYDKIYNYLLQPTTSGEGGYWTTFDWNSALELGSAATGLAYSGEYGFTNTDMYWTLSHMVAPAENALQCTDCHSDNGRMDWAALGYYGDPMIWGGREVK